VAILGSIRSALPERTRALFTRIAEKGAVVTPYAEDVHRRGNFPGERLVAALAEAVVVVEAPAR